ncbi:MAG: hypothetical protein M1826_007178 [Phylliscum demangeonii]|nr:MAG: hypothetical protein M1826_007178 [Phylliscum demangeonii]
MKLLTLLISVGHLARVATALVAPATDAGRPMAKRPLALKARSASPFPPEIPHRPQHWVGAPAPAPRDEYPRKAEYRTLSDTDYRVLFEHTLQYGLVATAADVQRINQIQAVYDRFLHDQEQQRHTSGVQAVVQGSLRWMDEQAWHLQYPGLQSLGLQSREEADGMFVYCLKLHVPATHESARLAVWPDGIRLCDGQVHPTTELREAMEKVFRNEKKTAVVRQRQAWKHTWL